MTITVRADFRITPGIVGTNGQSYSREAAVAKSSDAQGFLTWVRKLIEAEDIRVTRWYMRERLAEFDRTPAAARPAAQRRLVERGWHQGLTRDAASSVFTLMMHAALRDAVDATPLSPGARAAIVGAQRLLERSLFNPFRSAQDLAAARSTLAALEPADYFRAYEMLRLSDKKALFSGRHTGLEPGPFGPLTEAKALALGRSLGLGDKVAEQAALHLRMNWLDLYAGK